MALSGAGAERIRVVRIIARLNVGGPAIQAITLTKCLDPLGYRTTLVRGREEPEEGSMDYLADELGVRPLLVPSLRRNPGWRDVRALLGLIGALRRERPEIVHTHAAKGGTLGRVAALAIGRLSGRRPILIHTYHGHSLTGYFSPRSATVYRRIERLLACFTDVLIAVSDEVRDELVSLGVADADRFEVVPLGFDLRPFLVGPDERRLRRDRLRSELGVPTDDQLVTLIARLVPIKRVDRFLRVAGSLAARHPGLHFLVVGDGEQREQLRFSPDAVELDGRLTWAGFRRDIPDVCFASDAVVLTSDNEGTPVSLIEARAAGTPVVATRVGGVASVMPDFVVDPSDERAMATAVSRMLDDASAPERARAGSSEVARTFSLEALVERVDELYRGLLSSYAARALPPTSACPACESPSRQVLSRFRAVGLVRCSACGLAYTARRPSDDELAAWYADYPVDVDLSPATAARLEELVRSFAPYRRLGSLLDVGAGDGHLLAAAASAGWTPHGVELGPRQRQRLATRGFALHPPLLDVCDLPDQCMDVVVLQEVIEHMRDPAAELREVARLLRPGGLLYVTCPNFASLHGRLLGPRWRVVEYPEHLNYFRPSALRSLMSRCGFRELATSTTGLSVEIAGGAANERVRDAATRYRAIAALRRGANAALSALELGDTVKGRYERDSTF